MSDGQVLVSDDDQLQIQIAEWEFFVDHQLKPGLEQLERLATQALIRINAVEGRAENEQKGSYTASYENGMISFQHGNLQGRVRMRSLSIVSGQFKFGFQRMRGGIFSTYINNHKFPLTQAIDAERLLSALPVMWVTAREVISESTRKDRRPTTLRQFERSVVEVERILAELLSMVSRATESLRCGPHQFPAQPHIPTVEPPAPSELVLSMQLSQAALVIVAAVLHARAVGSNPQVGVDSISVQPAVARGQIVVHKGIQAEVVDVCHVVCPMPPLQDLVPLLGKMFQVATLMHQNASAHLLVLSSLCDDEDNDRHKQMVLCRNR
jgi:hypothetical protein